MILTDCRNRRFSGCHQLPLDTWFFWKGILLRAARRALAVLLSIYHFLTNMSALHFVKAFKAVQALCCSLLKHFHFFSHRIEASSVLNCNGQNQCGLVSFLFPSQVLAYQSDSSLPALPLFLHLSLVGLTCGGQAQQCKSAPESGMQLISSQFRELEQQHTLHFLRRGPGIWEEGTQWDFS